MAHPQAATPRFAPPHSRLIVDEPGSRPRSGLSGRNDTPAWVDGLEGRHNRWASVVTLAIASASLLGRMSVGAELALLAVPVAIVGLPHGALDYVSGRLAFERRWGARWWLPFGAIYLGLAALVVVSWASFPIISLLAFLIIGAAHFGFGDARAPFAVASETSLRGLGMTIESVARGGLVILVPAFVHPEDVSRLFAQLVSTSPATFEETLIALGPHFFVVHGTLLTIVLVHHLGGWAQGSVVHGRLAVEIISLTALFVLASPLVAFTVYFCLWHSFRHALHLSADLEPSGPRRAFCRFARLAWPTTLGAIALGLAGYLLSGAPSAQIGVLRVVFIGLSALTVPHIVFCGLADRARGQRDRRNR